MLNYLNQNSLKPLSYRYKIGVCALLVLLTFSGVEKANAVSAGSKCTKLGQIKVSSGKKLTCSLIWTETGSSTSTEKPAKDSSKNSALQSKSFRLESVSFNSDLGSAGASARVINISRTTKTATMSISIFGPDGKTVLFNMMGVVNAVPAGQTVTATFTSINGEFPSGQFKYSFQVDAEF